MSVLTVEQQVELLAAKFHAIYQEEAKRQGDVRHKDAYADLPENIKEYDRVLARFVLNVQNALRKQLAQEEGENVSLSRVVGQRGKEIQALKAQIATARLEELRGLLRYGYETTMAAVDKRVIDRRIEELEKAEKAQAYDGQRLTTDA